MGLMSLCSTEELIMAFETALLIFVIWFYGGIVVHIGVVWFWLWWIK